MSAFPHLFTPWSRQRGTQRDMEHGRGRFIGTACIAQGVELEHDGRELVHDRLHGSFLMLHVRRGVLLMHR